MMMMLLVAVITLAVIEFEELDSKPLLPECTFGAYDLQGLGGSVTVSCIGSASKPILLVNIDSGGLITFGQSYPATQRVITQFGSEEIVYLFDTASDTITPLDVTNISSFVIGTPHSLGGEGNGLEVAPSWNILVSNSSGVHHLIPSSPLTFSSPSYNVMHTIDFSVVQTFSTEEKTYLFNATNFFRVYSNMPGTRQIDTSRTLTVNRIVGDSILVKPVRFGHEATWNTYFTLENGVVYRWDESNTNIETITDPSTFGDMCLLEELQLVIVNAGNDILSFKYNETDVWAAGTYGNATSVQLVHCEGKGRNMVYFINRSDRELASLRVIDKSPTPAPDTEAPPTLVPTAVPTQVPTATPTSLPTAQPLPTVTEVVDPGQYLTFSDIPESTQTAVGASSVVGGVAAITGPSAGVTIIRGVTLARGLLCSEEDEELPIIMHPLMFPIDSSYWAGSVVGNLSICAGFMFIIWALTFAFSEKTLRYPSRLSPFYQLLFPSILECALHLLFNKKIVYIGVLGLLGTVVFCSYTWMYGKADHEQCEILNQSEQHFIARYFVGTMVWVSTKDNGYAEKYGVVFEGFRYFPKLRGHYFLIEFAHVLAISFFSALSWFSRTGCLFKTAGISLTMVIQTAIVFFIPCFIAPFLNHLTILTCLVMCISCILAFVSFAVNGALEGGLGEASLQLLAASFWLATVRGVYDVVLFIVDVVFGYTRGIPPESVDHRSDASSHQMLQKRATFSFANSPSLDPASPLTEMEPVSGYNELDDSSTEPDLHGRGYFIF